LIFQNPVSVTGIFGYSITVTGVFLYSEAKKRSRSNWDIDDERCLQRLILLYFMLNYLSARSSNVFEASLCGRCCDSSVFIEIKRYSCQAFAGLPTSHAMASTYLKNRRNITVFLSHRYGQTSDNPTLENVNDCLSHNHLKISVIALKETSETSND